MWLSFQSECYRSILFLSICLFRPMVLCCAGTQLGDGNGQKQSIINHTDTATVVCLGFHPAAEHRVLSPLKSQNPTWVLKSPQVSGQKEATESFNLAFTRADVVIASPVSSPNPFLGNPYQVSGFRSGGKKSLSYSNLCSQTFCLVFPHPQRSTLWKTKAKKRLKAASRVRLSPEL